MHNSPAAPPFLDIEEAAPAPACIEAMYITSHVQLTSFPRSAATAIAAAAAEAAAAAAAAAATFCALARLGRPGGDETRQSTVNGSATI